MARNVPQWSEDVVPTVAFNLRKVRKGNVTFKIWDVAGAFSLSGRRTRMQYLPLNVGWRIHVGQPKFRSMWERYCHGVDAVVCVFQCFIPGPFIRLISSIEQFCRRLNRRSSTPFTSHPLPSHPLTPVHIHNSKRSLSLPVSNFTRY